MRLCILSCVMSKIPKETELDDIVKIMRNSINLRGLCKTYSKHIENGNKVKGNKIKRRLIPAFIPSALIYNGKGHRNIVGLTNLCYIDIDHIDEKQINWTIDVLRQDEHVILALRSMSGKGLHIFIKYEFENIEQPTINNMSWKMMVKTYKSVFNTISKFYGNVLNLPIDESGQNAVQSCNISYDNDLYYNPNALPYTLVYEKGADTYDITNATNSIMNSLETMTEIAKGIDDIKNGRCFTLGDDEDVENFMQKSLSIEDTSNLLASSEIYFLQGKLSEAGRLLQYCSKVLSSFNPIGEKMRCKMLESQNKLDDLARKMVIVKQLISSTPEEQKAFVEKDGITRGETDICQAFTNYGKLLMINDLLIQVEYDLSDNKIEAYEKLVSCRRILNELHCPYKKELLKEYKPRISEKESKAKEFVRQNNYKSTILFLIERFETLRSTFDLGNIEECINILERIHRKLKKLPIDSNTDVLRKQYESWYWNLYLKE